MTVPWFEETWHLPTQQPRDLELRGICRSFPILLPVVILTASACHTISHRRRRKYWPQTMHLISFLRSLLDFSRAACLSVGISALKSDLWHHFWCLFLSHLAHLPPKNSCCLHWNLFKQERPFLGAVLVSQGSSELELASIVKVQTKEYISIPVLVNETINQSI